MAAVAALGAGPAFAQVPAVNWTGFYAGLHAGAGWSHRAADASMQRFTGLPPGVAQPLQSSDLSTSDNPFALGGGQVGYNWQLQQYVLGIEADWSAASDGATGTAAFAEGPIASTVSAHYGLDWYGTVRGRIGYLPMPTLLAYVTGGFAYGRVRQEVTTIATGPGPVGTFVISSDGSGVKGGWTVGGGFEHRLDQFWSVKLEYDYLHLDSAWSDSNTIAFTPGRGGNRGVYTTSTGDYEAHTIQVGLNYRFWTH